MRSDFDSSGTGRDEPLTARCDDSRLCDEVDGQTATPFHEIYQGKPPSRRVYESEAFIGLIDLAPLCEGHTLLVPRRHVSSIAQLGASQRAAWREALSDLVSLIESHFGAPTLIEHGSAPDRQGGSCVAHAHLHLLPGHWPIDELVRERGLTGKDLRLESVPGHEILERTHYYLYAYGERAVFFSEGTEILPRLFNRQAAAGLMGLEETASDWAFSADLGVLRRTVARLRGKGSP